MSYIRIQKAVFRPTHPFSYHYGEDAEIKAVVIFTPVGKEPRPCYLIEFPNGDMDYVVISDNDYDLVPKE